jgi:hypothetical protein
MTDVIANLKPARSLALAAIFCVLSAGAAAAQEERPWRSPDNAFEVTLPEMWNIVRGEGDVLLVVRSLGMGPAGPAEIVCTIEKDVVPSDVEFNRDQLNAMTAVLSGQRAEQVVGATPSGALVVDGVRVGGHEVEGMSDSLHERLFERLFLMPEPRSVARYLIACAVRTVRPAGDVDFASTRAFLSSLRISAEPKP